MTKLPIAIFASCLISASAFAAGTETADESATAETDAAYEITGDAAKGERVFKKCKACHAVGEGAKTKTGPILNGIIGRAAGAEEDYKYSKALMEAAEGGLVWTPESLSAFLEKPKAYMKGTKMSFSGLRKPADRENVIAYLDGFSTD